jgi:hypothetical protein
MEKGRMIEQFPDDEAARLLRAYARSETLTAVSVRAGNLVREFGMAGSLSEASRAAAGFGLQGKDVVTPGNVVGMVLCWEVARRLERSGGRPQVVSGGLPPVLAPEDALRLVQTLAGDARLLGQEEKHPRLYTLDTSVALLSGIWTQDATAQGERDELLLFAAGTLRDVGGLTEEQDPGLGRGRSTGPWDVSELAGGEGNARGLVVPSGTTLRDFGGLKVPVGPDTEVRLLQSAPGAGLFGVQLVRAGTLLQLQAFHADPAKPWLRVCAELRDKFIESGGTAVQWIAEAGLEVRGTTRHTEQDGSVTETNMRFFGCDGPGWLLRAMVAGAAARRYSFDPWPYEVFAATVVDARQGSREPGTDILLTAPGTNNG